MMHLSEEHKRLVKLYAFTSGATSPTPRPLVEEMVFKLDEEIIKNPNSKFLDPAAGTGTFGVVFYERLLKYHSSDWIMNNMIFMVDVSSLNCDVLRKLGFVNVYNEDFLNWETKMKFDAIIGNPPYQKEVGPSKTEPIWNLFVEKALKHLKEGGYLSLIHPNGWRNVDGKFKKIQKLLLSKDIQYLEMHTVEDGMKTFGASTAYDYYILINREYSGKTHIKFDDGTEGIYDISNMEFIPNSNLDKINSLLANNDEECVNVLYSRSDYGTDKKNTNQEKTDEFKYPCVYSIIGNNEPTFYYSNTNQKGHFGISKLILGNGANPKCFIDYSGDYGMTQFAFGIIDDTENLEKIKKALESSEFKKINLATKFVSTAGNPLVYPKIISLFRKEFWKEFI